ncbi:ferritin-like fold-containing protein [Nocardioides cheoyonin]|uniref:ferritin-like fold-containing protein n=1 Tax=Nocardioides cheoyonin TaxID=3156615 RepID=UPI0032B6061B
MVASQGPDAAVPPSSEPSSASFEDPVYRAAVIDLLGAVGYGEISAFERLSADGRMAPTLPDKVALHGMASAQYAKVPPLVARLKELGVDPYAAMEPFREAFDVFHAHTAPSDWWESLVKAYVGDGLANDFYREIAAYLDGDTKGLVLDTLEDTGRSEFAVERIRAGIEADPKIAGRLALWGRRLMGEAFTQAQHVAAERDALSDLLAGGHIDGLDLTTVADMFTRITHRHVERMGRLGLAH